MNKEDISAIIADLGVNVHDNLGYIKDEIDNIVVKRRINQIMEKVMKLINEVEEIIENEEDLQKIKPKVNYTVRATNSNALSDEQGRGRSAIR